MATDYTALDAAILEHIRSGKPNHPMYVKACRDLASLASKSESWRTIDCRLQALRKAGRIRHVKPSPCGPDHGWVIVEPPADG